MLRKAACTWSVFLGLRHRHLAQVMSLLITGQSLLDLGQGVRDSSVNYSGCLTKQTYQIECVAPNGFTLYLEDTPAG
jgi:hypothetical protein